VATIPQRELRNNVSAILRRAESGEHFIVTVDGRPVAELGPQAQSRPPAPPARLSEILRDAAVDRGWASELAALRDEDQAAAHEPWSK